MERKELFEDFSKRIAQIMEHYDDVEQLDFSAKLKNGTRFAIDYDSDRFERERRGENGKGQLVSVFNGVVDIIAATAALVLMILHISLGTRAFTLVLTTYIAYFTFFCTSAVYHLFDEKLSRAVRALFMVRMGLLALTQALMMTSIVAACSGRTLFAFTITMLIAAASLFFTSLSTKGAFRAASLCLGLMALATPLFIGRLDSLVALTCSLALISGIVPSCMPTTKSRLMRNNRTLGIFYLVTLASYFLLVG